MRRRNLARVMHAVSAEGPLSRAAVASRIGLTRAAVSTLVDELIRTGLLEELGPERPGRVGRPGSALAGSGRGPAPSATPSASPAATPVASPGAVSRTPTTQMIVAGHATVAITDDAMTPAHFESAVGRHVQLTVVNAGSRTHNFTMAAFAIDIDLAPGDAVTFDLGVPDLGDYPYFSDLPGDEDLKGTMTVFI
jgi:hypothetical protein